MNITLFGYQLSTITLINFYIQEYLYTIEMEYEGLNDLEVKTNRKAFGSNVLAEKARNPIWVILFEILKEPLFVILLVAASIYFILDETTEGIIMLVAIGLVSGISIFQESKSRNAIDELKKLSAPLAKVYRNGKLLKIPTDEIVVKDYILVEDGALIPADARIIEAHDFSVDESILTGESLSISKNENSQAPEIFKGTLVDTGNCVAEVVAVGKSTKVGKIGKSIEDIEQTKTPLQLQIKRFVRSMVIFGAIAFFMVWGINFYLAGEFFNALLQGLTLAMSILPEEIPVAFSTFMALGAFRLYKNKVISRSPYTVETLGAATVICTDKTGTLTENIMELRAIYELSSDSIQDLSTSNTEATETLYYAVWASEILPFDSMEKSIHSSYKKLASRDERLTTKMIHEYPLGGKPPIMTHIFEKDSGEKIIAVKGSVEGVLAQCHLSESEELRVLKQSDIFSSKGYRVLAVGRADPSTFPYPKTQQEFEFECLGLLAFYDPPKENMTEVLKTFYSAGIDVKMITGDHIQTAKAIASQIGMKSSGIVLTGDDIMPLDIHELRQKVKETHVFARMFPQAKLRVVEALKLNGEVVAMTGDGVNDGPALKAAHIGIAMGARGSEVAKSAAALVLLDDDLGHMTEAIAQGRRIYENLKKAIQYIISIHIPIILIVLLPLLFGWDYINIFSPIHVIFLELIMGPTCSIVFENEPIESGSMKKGPRKVSETFFSWSELSISIVQGFVITIGCLGYGFYLMSMGYSEATVRTLIFSTLVFSNIFLTLVNRSFHYSVLKTLGYKNQLVPIVLCISILLLFLILTIPSIRTVFDFEKVKFSLLLYSLASAYVGVFWLEIWKFLKRRSDSLNLVQIKKIEFSKLE